MLDLLFREQKYGAVSNITIDAVVKEQYVQNARATDHYVEEGSNISDHIRPDPMFITLMGTISNHPIKDVWNFNPLAGDRDLLSTIGSAFNVPTDFVPDGDFTDNTADGANMIPFLPGAGFAVASFAMASNPLEAISNITTANTFMFDREFDRAANAFNEFIKKVQEGKTVEIATSFKIYKDMAIESFNVDRDAESGDALIFTLTARQIRFVTTGIEFTTLPSIPSGKGKKSTGTQAASKADPAKSSKSKDVLLGRKSALRGMD